MASPIGSSQDPSALTLAALAAAQTAQEKLFRTEMDAQKEAVKLLQANADRTPSIAVVNQDLIGFKELSVERFETIIEKLNGIKTQILERDTRSKEAKEADATNIKTALDAQKEAAAKAEAAFAKTTDGILRQIDQSAGVTIRAIDDLKERLGSREGVTKGADATWAYVLALGAVLFSVVMGIVPYLSK